jgi:hypothetical protein
MIPTMKLGPWDSPLAEFMPQEIHPIIALTVDGDASLDADQLRSVWTLLQLDTVFLNKDSEAFFLKVENVCRIVAGEATNYNVSKIDSSDFVDYLKGCAKDGIVTPDVTVAAQRYLDLLDSNPEYWPLR